MNKRSKPIIVQPGAGKDLHAFGDVLSGPDMKRIVEISREHGIEFVQEVQK